MGNVELLRSEYWSKSKSFLLPLTGISRIQKYDVETFLFWDDYSIENYNLMVKFAYDNYEKFVEYCRKNIFPVWDKNGYVVECYDFGSESIFVLDISEWALDIQMFLAGKYSKMSQEAKDIIERYHIFYNKGEQQIEIEIAATLEPLRKYEILNNLTAIEYVADYYDLPLAELQKVGEIGGMYDSGKERLLYLSAKTADER